MNLEDLVKTFAEHERLAQQTRKESIDQFKEIFPNEELPEHFKSDFSITAALGFMCSEILKLKRGEQRK